jgi:hypothetical protein
MLQIKQLTVIAPGYITCEQQEIHGGSHITNLHDDEKSSEELWSGYASGEYDIKYDESNQFNNSEIEFYSSYSTENSTESRKEGELQLS